MKLEKTWSTVTLFIISPNDIDDLRQNKYSQFKFSAELSYPKTFISFIFAQLIKSTLENTKTI